MKKSKSNKTEMTNKTEMNNKKEEIVLSEESLQIIGNRANNLIEETKSLQPMRVLDWYARHSISEKVILRLLKLNSYPYFKFGNEQTAFELHMNLSIRSEYSRRIQRQLENREKARIRGKKLASFMRSRRASESSESSESLDSPESSA